MTREELKSKGKVVGKTLYLPQGISANSNLHDRDSQIDHTNLYQFGNKILIKNPFLRIISTDDITRASNRRPKY